jgi:transposase
LSKCRVVVVAGSSAATLGWDCLEWALVRDLLPVPSWMAGRGGRPEGYCHRQMIDAVRYLVDNGIKWRAMPCDFPP